MYEILCNIYVELPMEAKSLLPKLPRIIQAINEKGISFNLSLGMGEGGTRNKTCLDLCCVLGTFFISLLMLQLRNSVYSNLIVANLLQKEKNNPTSWIFNGRLAVLT